MDLYIEMYNLFFQDENKNKNLKLPNNIKQWASKNQIGTNNQTVLPKS